MPLLGPMGQIIRLPDLDVFGSVGLGTHETAQASRSIGASGDFQIGSQHVELVAILRPHDEGIAKPLLALAGGEEGRTVVQRVPVQCIVALGRSQADLLAADALAGEECPDIGLVLGVVGRHGLHLKGELLDQLAVTMPDLQAQHYGCSRLAGSRTVDLHGL